MTQHVIVPGYVWCDYHGCIHADNCDPYGYGEPDCTKDVHRPVYVRAREDETQFAPARGRS